MSVVSVKRLKKMWLRELYILEIMKQVTSISFSKNEMADLEFTG